MAAAWDTRQRRAIDVAAENNRRHLEQRMLYHSRYKAAEGTLVHESATCRVLVADDIYSNERVALKLMRNEDDLS